MSTPTIPHVDYLTARYGGQDHIVIELHQGDRPFARVGIGSCAAFELRDQLDRALSTGLSRQPPSI